MSGKPRGNVHAACGRKKERETEHGYDSHWQERASVVVFVDIIACPAHPESGSCEDHDWITAMPLGQVVSRHLSL